MLISQQFFYVLIGAGVLLGLPAFWLFSHAMWPRMTERARETASRGLLVPFLIGVPVVAVLLVIVTAAGKRGQVGGLLAIGLGGLGVLWGVSALTGLAMHIGSRLWPDSQGDESWRALWRGGLVISGVLAIPFIGWYVLLTVLLCIGLGMWVRMWFPRTAPVEATLPPPVMPASSLPAEAPPLPQAQAQA